MLISPMRSLGVTLGLAQRATASGARIFQVLDRAPRLTSAPDAPPRPPASGHVRLEGVTLRYDDADDFGAAYRSHVETTDTAPDTPAGAGGTASTNGRAGVTDGPGGPD